MEFVAGNGWLILCFRIVMIGVVDAQISVMDSLALSIVIDKDAVNTLETIRMMKSLIVKKGKTQGQFYRWIQNPDLSRDSNPCGGKDDPGLLQKFS
jgi:hypothetical protein